MKSKIKFIAVTLITVVITWFLLTRTVGTRVVPLVIGMSEKTAVSKLDKTDLDASVKRVFHQNQKKGIVFKQLPTHKQKVRAGRTVKLWISKGPAKTEVPMLSGLSLTEAKNKLRISGRGKDMISGGLKLSTISRTPHELIPRDIVISQYPLAGNIISVGDSVHLLISTGKYPKTVIVPAIVDLTREEAEAALRYHGLIVQRITHEISVDSPNLVIRVTPSAGTPLQTGDFVTLTMGIPQVSQRSLEKRWVMVRFIVPLLLESKEINLVLTDQETVRTIYSGDPVQGRVLDFTEEVTGDATLKIYIDRILSQTRLFPIPIK